MNDSIYHYTNWTGLLGILRSRTLWVSDSQYLNDPQELRYACGELLKHLESLKRREPVQTDSEQSRCADFTWIGTLLEKRYPRDGAVNTYLEDSPFVASFCTHDDLLSMWRGYASGGGFAIGFDPTILEDSCNATCWPKGETRYGLTPEETLDLSDRNFGLHGEIIPVAYGSVEVEPMLNEIEQSQRGDGDALVSRWLIRVKDPAYKEEREIRLVVWPTTCMLGAVALRASGTNLVPYRAVVFPFAAIRSITVGPGPYQRRNVWALEQWLRSSGARGEWTHLSIRPSKVPYLG